MPPDQLVARATRQRLQLRIGVEQFSAFRIDHEDGVVGQLDQAPIPLFGFTRLVCRTLLIVDIAQHPRKTRRSLPPRTLCANTKPA